MRDKFTVDGVAFTGRWTISGTADVTLDNGRRFVAKIDNGMTVDEMLDRMIAGEQTGAPTEPSATGNLIECSPDAES